MTIDNKLMFGTHIKEKINICVMHNVTIYSSRCCDMTLQDLAMPFRTWSTVVHFVLVLER